MGKLAAVKGKGEKGVYMNYNYLAQFYGKSSNYTDIPNHLYKEYNVKKGLRNETAQASAWV